MKLIAMTDFVLEQKDNYFNQRFFKIENYAKFLKQPLELWMFFPCDLIKGKIVALNEGDEHYQQAKERCLFEFKLLYIGFSKSDMEASTIEDLLSDDIEYILSKTAIKQIGL